MKFKDLALELSIEGATLTGLLDRMERAELLRRSPDPDDRRSILVFLTSKGQEVGSQLKSLVVDLDSNIRNQFSEEEYNQFLLVLDSMVVPDQL
jgi:DNA-binding MarR family transcriptional regulator